MNTAKIFVLPIVAVFAFVLAGCEKNVRPTPTTATATQTTTQPATSSSGSSSTSSQTTTPGGSKSTSTTTTTVTKPPVVVAPGAVQPYNQVTPAAKAAGVHRAIKKPIRRGGAVKYHNR